MTKDEWVEVVAVIDGNWPHAAMDEHAIRTQAALVTDVDRDDAIRAVAEIARGGARFPPTAGMIVAHLASPPAPHPPDDESIGLLEQATRRVGRSVYADDFHDRHQAAVDWLAERDPVLAAYAARRGLCGPGSFGAEEIHSDHGGAVRHRLVGEIRDAYRHADERAARGLPAVEPGMLLVRHTGAVSGGMAELVDRLRPARQIGA